MSRRSLTGGTGDVKPQILTLDTPFTTNINRVVAAKIPLPVSRITSRGKRAQILEILKVWFYPGLDNIEDANLVMAGQLSTKLIFPTESVATTPILANLCREPTVIASFMSRGVFQTAGASNVIFPVARDLTDNAGNGVLVATDNIFVTFGFVDLTIVDPVRMSVKILYRFVNVGIEEYVGIVQSQQ